MEAQALRMNRMFKLKREHKHWQRRKVSEWVSQSVSWSVIQPLNSQWYIVVFLCWHITVMRDAHPDCEGPKVEGVDVDI